MAVGHHHHQHRRYHHHFQRFQGFHFPMETPGGVALIIFQLLVMQIGLAVPDTHGPAEYCHRESFNATCHENQVIFMESARYGRMKVSRCVKKNLGYLGCAVDVLGLVDARCSGRQTCTVRTQDDTLYQTHPCPDDTTSYLETKYTCLPVSYDEKHECTKDGRIKLRSPTGFLASSMSENYGFGTSACPWVINVPPGQRLNLTLYNFARFPRADVATGILPPDPSVCYEIATILDGRLRKNILTCGTDGRIKPVYISRSNTLEIRFVDRSVLRSLGQFLLHYKAAGCADVKAPKYGYVRREGETAIVSCNYTEETWYLTCEGDRWIGSVGNCSSGNRWSAVELFGNGDDFPYGILLVVAIGVALGVFLGGLLLSIAIYYIKRKQRHETAQQGAESGDVMVDVKEVVEDGERSLQWRPSYTDPRYPGGQYPGGTLRREGGTLDKRSEQYGPGRIIHPHDKDYGTNNRNHIYESPQFS